MGLREGFISIYNNFPVYLKENGMGIYKDNYLQV